MRRHISLHRATTKYFSNSFIFKTKIEKEGLPRDSTPDLGAGGPEFNLGAPTKNISRVFFSLLKAPFTSDPICGIHPHICYMPGDGLAKMARSHFHRQTPGPRDEKGEPCQTVNGDGRQFEEGL
jgi:hypothetical protein